MSHESVDPGSGEVERSPAPFGWPVGRRFAFSIFDDTDGTTVETGRPVYKLLTELGVKVTKSVWPLDAPGSPTVGGDSCEDADYLAWVLDLQGAGHEIGYHHASDGSSMRERSIAALDRFEELFGHPPRVGADHAGNRESLYAGADRLSGSRSIAYRLAERAVQPGRPSFDGARTGSPWYWGDVCRDRIRYWRGLTFARTDLGMLPSPYHDPRRPWVNRWFLSSDAPRLDDVLERLDPTRLDRLERCGGVCILYTHLGLDAAPGGRLDARLERALRGLADRGGWFVPVTELLDHMVASSDERDHVISDRSRARLERRWITDRIRHRARLGPVVQTVEQA